MTMQEFNDTKKSIQTQVDDVIEQLNKLSKVNIQNAEAMHEVYDSVCLAADRINSAQIQFRNLLRNYYEPEQEQNQQEEDEDVCYEEEEVPQQPDQVEPDPAVQQQAMLQNIITGVTALVGAYGIFKNLKK